MLGAKILLDLHDPMPELMMTISSLNAEAWRVRFLQRLERWSIRLADAVLTVNLACKAIVGARSCRLEKIDVIMNSPDDRLFPFRPASDLTACPRGRAFTIMYHGTLVERNGLDLAVEALARVRQSVPQAELRVYGHPTPFLDRTMNTVRQSGLSSAIHYCGPQRLEDLSALIDACDLGVIPNQPSVFTRLNTPTRIFEYLARGKPVIAPRAPGIQDYFAEGSLFFFELGNADDLALGIQYVVAHPDEAVEITKRGQAVYLAHTWDQERRTFLNRVRALLGEAVQPS
jgi:glycosyltransferase involved in cell wall biosynthesis